MKGDVRYIVRGAVVGAILGAVVGLLLGSIGSAERPEDERPLETGRVFKLGLAALGLIRQLADL